MSDPRGMARRAAALTAGLVLAVQAGASATQSAAAAAATAGQVRVGGFYIDRYEYPNIAGRVPLSEVSWDEARQLCAARSQRLCTEQEWEAACRGPEGLAYGYGPEFEPGRCNTPYREGDTWRRDHGTAASGQFGGCTNGYGVGDMIGNLWEWTDGWYDADRGWRVVRGGSWFHSANLARADGRYGRFLTAQYRLDLVGFRCCRSAADDAPAAPVAP